MQKSPASFNPTNNLIRQNINVLRVFFCRKQGLCSPWITKHWGTLDETRNIIRETEANQQQGCE